MSHGPVFHAPFEHALLLDFEGDRRDIGAYQAAGGYRSLDRALGMSFEQTVNELKASGLRGRGGAGFPTGMKASFIGQARPRYLVVNADESEPGTFKDRELMLRNPHALVEGCLILCAAIEADAAYIYIRGEYATEAEVLEAAVSQAEEAGLIGTPRGDRGFVGRVVVHRGAGAYICGEETALLASLNGDRGQPTAKPPFPAVSGAWRKPTLLNNVETVAAVPFIVALGGERYGQIGPDKAHGTRLYSVSGHVNRPGNYELVMSMTFRDVIEDVCGGIKDGRSLKAFVPGGSSTPILTADEVDTGLDYDSIAAAGSMSGSGAVIVLDDRTCMVQFALRTAEFYRHESCGKCTPCREGVRWTCDLLKGFLDGTAEPGDIDLLLDICDKIEGNCLCPLGDACAMPVRAILKKFRHEFEACLELGGSPLAESSPLTSLYPTLKKLLPMVPA